MKVLVGHFMSESNEHSRQVMGFDNFIFKHGEASIEAMNVKDIFDDAGIELIPSIFASGHPGGPVTKDTFDFILERMTRSINENLNDIDGIYLFLHGASKVTGLEGGSAEHTILKEIRKIVGPYLPIAVVMDPHGNLSKDYVEMANILRCYRESPHTDSVETHRIVAKMFVELLENRRPVTPVYRKVPIIVGGERSVSTDEPVLSFNKKLDEMEQDERIMSASFHVGYLRHDGDKLGCSVVVVPSHNKYRDYAEEKATEMYDYIVSRRHDFEYHGITAVPEEAIKTVVEYDGTPVFLTDSGDNCGAGGDGYNTYVFRQFYELEDHNDKEILISGIVDQKNFPDLYEREVGEEVSFNLGMDYDELTKATPITGKIVAKGLASDRYEEKPELGTSIAVKLDNKPITVVVLNEGIQYYTVEQFESSNLNVFDYDIIVVKQGYISPHFTEISPFTIMSLTDGPTNQRSENLVFRRIRRPMFPYDELDEFDLEHPDRGKEDFVR